MQSRVVSLLALVALMLCPFAYANDIEGRWIGINGRASFEKRGRVNTGAAYAISLRQIQLFLGALKCGLIVDHGITDFTTETLENGKVVVSRISEVSEAWRRGVRPQSEIISFAGRQISSANDFQNILGIFPVGTRLPLSKAAEAHRLLEGRSTIGSTILIPEAGQEAGR